MRQGNGGGSRPTRTVPGSELTTSKGRTSYPSREREARYQPSIGPERTPPTRRTKPAFGDADRPALSQAVDHDFGSGAVAHW
jgi:hypothetical protein